MKEQTNRKWKKRVLVGLLVYAVTGTILYFLQDRLLFRPQPLPADYKFQFREPFKEVNIPVNAVTNLNLVQFASTDSNTRGVVLYFHGNRDNITRYEKYAPYFTKHGYEVWMMDYPGYGKSTGARTEKILYERAAQVYKLARSRFSRDQIIIYGKSIGSGIAAQLASVSNCQRLILETPYYSIPSLAKRYLFIYPVDLFIRYRIPSWQYLEKVESPVTIFHGTSDAVIPYSNAGRLKQYLKPGDEFITLANAGHNDCYNFREMTDKLDSLLR